MRLIDADKLIEICDKGWRLGSAINTRTYHTVDASDIRSQPTVNAIPIEWIKSIINANIYLWENNKDRMFVDQGAVTVVSYSITAQILSELIDRWEKENE